MKLYQPKQNLKYIDITLEDWKEDLRVVFVRELEVAIENHMTFLSKISGIKKFKTDSQSNYSQQWIIVLRKKGQNNEDGDGGGVEDAKGYEDLGSNAQEKTTRN